MLKEPDILNTWLIVHGLGGSRLFVFAVYFGIAHPLLEQLHLEALLSNKGWGRATHFAYAGYHALVLFPLLNYASVFVSLTILVLISIVWRLVSSRKGGLLLPALTHILADLSIIGAVVFYVMV